MTCSVVYCSVVYAGVTDSCDFIYLFNFNY